MKYENYLLLFTPCTIQHHIINCLLVSSEADTYLHRFKVLLHRVQGLLLASSWVESWGIAAGQAVNLDRGLQTESLTQVKILTCTECIAFSITCTLDMAFYWKNAWAGLILVIHVVHVVSWAIDLQVHH